MSLQRITQFLPPYNSGRTFSRLRFTWNRRREGTSAVARFGHSMRLLAWGAGKQKRDRQLVYSRKQRYKYAISEVSLVFSNGFLSPFRGLGMERFLFHPSNEFLADGFLTVIGPCQIKGHRNI
ncbi:hypothetical protein TNCV_770401 [Trichonephila clavipes]|nr:hypothetical protein TNCV_770401 [Trichonephila clavipes]